jgi:hypothetical protein
MSAETSLGLIVEYARADYADAVSGFQLGVDERWSAMSSGVVWAFGWDKELSLAKDGGYREERK